ncbi:retrovirus-related pol polyprotein from transposon TNT 1-94, partial [Tanacetum coccineum]
MPSISSPEPAISCFDDLDFFKGFENEFPAIVYNDAQTSKPDLLTKPILNPQHIDEFDLSDETSLSEYDEEEQNVLYFNDLFPFNIIRPDDLKSEKDKDDNDIDITQSLLDNEITHGSTMLFETSHDKGGQDMALLPRGQRHRFLRTKPDSKFNNVVHGYRTEPSRIFTQKARMEIREMIPSEKKDEEKSNLKTSLKRRAFWSLNGDILKITILKTNTPYPSRKIRRIRACTHQRPQRNKDQYATTIPKTVAFQTEDLDAYDFDCDDVSNAKAFLMANLSNYGSDVILEVPHNEPYYTDMDNQSVHIIQGFEQTLVVDFTDNEITSDSNITLYSQYLQETQQAAVQDTNLYAQQDSMILYVIEQMSEQMINHVNNWKKANQEKNNESLTAELERYKERVKTFEQRLNIDLSTREKMIDSQTNDMIKEKLALKQQIDSLEQTISNQIKEKESLLQTFIVFKNESKEKESKYMDIEIDLENKIKELYNIVYEVGQSAQTVHMLTKPQVFYDDTHIQALSYQNPFYLKKAQRIKPTLYDGSVISSQHVVSPVIDDEETLILEEVNSIKKIVTTALQSELKRLKGKHVLDNATTITNATTIAPRMFKLDIEHFSHGLKNNRDAHEDYLKKTIENTDTIRRHVERARKQNPSEPLLDSACKFTKHVQELLVYVSQTCPSFIKPSEKLVVVTPMNKVKKVRFSEPLTSSSNIHKHVESFKTSNSNTHVLSSTGLKCSTSTCRSQPIGNKKNDRISQKPSSNRKNKVEAVVQIVLWYLDFGCSKHMTGNRSQLMNFVSKFIGTIRFGNDQIAKIMGYGDYQLGNKDHLCSACALGKSKKSSHQLKSEDTNQEKLYLLHIDLCGPMRVESINGKNYILVIVDDYSQFTWVKFLRSKDEAPEAIIKCIKNIQVRLNATVCNIGTDNGTKFVNQTLREFYENFKTRASIYDSCNIQFRTLPNPIPQQPCNPPNRDDWVRLFQPMFDEYFNAPTIAVFPVPVTAAPRAVDIVNSLVSTSIDQDAPSISIPSTKEQEHSLIISQGVEESPKKLHFHDDPLHESLHKDSTSQGSSYNVILSHTQVELLGRWTKDHLIENVIRDPSRSVPTRKQLKTDVMWCYFNAFLTSVEPKNFKQAMTEPSWIDA